VPFKIKIEDETIIGRIDRIDLLKNGVEIIDYKTGKTKERLSPDEKQQLLIYQIGVKEALGIKPVKLSYYYLEDGKKVSFCGTEEEIQKEKERILKQIEEIKKSDFSPTPGWQCQFCDYRDVCSYAVIVNY
jgi:CRISPR-associated protein Cas4